MPARFLWPLRGLLIGLLFGAALLAGAPPATAANVQLDVRAGFDRYVRSGTWVPVQVTLTNTGSDQRVEVRVQRRGGPGLSPVSRQVDLPNQSRKQFTLMTLDDGVLTPLVVQALAGDTVLAEQAIETLPVPSDRALVGLLAAPPESNERLLKTLKGDTNQLARLAPEELPTNAFAWTGLNALVVNGQSTHALSPAQRAALSQWVGMGGRLVLGGGNAAATALEELGDLAPVRLTGPSISAVQLTGLEALANEPVKGLGPFAVAATEPVPGSLVVARQDNTPLIVTRPVGQGQVTFVALDLGLDPFPTWAGTAALWSKVLLPSAMMPGLARTILPEWEAGRLSAALGSGTALDLPAAGALALFLLVYIVVIGPVNYLVLRQFDRREWAYLTVPAITLLFLGGIYLLGAGARGDQVVVNSLSLVRSADGIAGAPVESYVGVFSPGRATRTLRLPANTVVTGLAGEPTLAPGGGLRTARANWPVSQGANTELRDIPFADADFKTFVAQGGVEAPPLATELRIEGDRLVGQVRNQGREPLTDTLLLVGQQWQPLGTLAPGASVAVDWSIPEPQGGDSETGPLSIRLTGGFGPGSANWRAQARFELLDALYGSQIEAGLAEGPLILAWQEGAAPLPLEVAGQTTRQQAVTLIMHRVRLTARPGELRLTPGLLPRRLELTEPGRRDGRPVLGAGVFGTSEVVFNFSLPPNLTTLSVEELTLVVGTHGPAGVPVARPPGVAFPTVQAGGFDPRFRFALWDHQQSVWVPLAQAGTGRSIVPQAQRFISRDGAIRLQVAVPDGRAFTSFSQIDLGARGQLP